MEQVLQLLQPVFCGYNEHSKYLTGKEIKIFGEWHGGWPIDEFDGKTCFQKCPKNIYGMLAARGRTGF